MSKKAELPLSPHHILLFDEDWSFLEDHYGVYSTNRIGAGVVVRRIVHRAVSLLKQAATEAADQRQGIATAEAVCPQEEGDSIRSALDQLRQLSCPDHGSFVRHLDGSMTCGFAGCEWHQEVNSDD